MPCVWSPFFIEFIHAIDVKLVKVDVEVDGAAEALDQGDDSGLGLRFFEPGFFAKMTRDCASDDVQNLAHDLGSDCEQQPDLDGKADHPLTNGLGFRGFALPGKRTTAGQVACKFLLVTWPFEECHCSVLENLLKLRRAKH